MELTFQELRDQAVALGWEDIGITQAHISDENIEAYKQWIDKSYHAQLSWMKNDLRCYPQKLLPGAQSAIIFISYYKQKKLPFCKDRGLIASYARGRDYHNIHRKRLKKFISWMERRLDREKIALAFSDSKPVMEKALAVQAGLGWFGKNTLLIHRRFGTFTLLSGLFTTVKLPEERVELRLARCGACTRCLDSCPTQALSPYLLDANSCLSNLLIESDKPLKEVNNPGYVFGCDICQDVCPHNQRTALHTHKDFYPMRDYLTPTDLLEYEKNPDLLNGSPLKRRGVEGLKNSLEYILGGGGLS